MAIYGAELPAGAILDEPQAGQYGAELPEGAVLDEVQPAGQAQGLSINREGLNESQLAAAEELVRRGRIAYAETPQPQATPEVMEYLSAQPEQAMGRMGVADPSGVGLTPQQQFSPDYTPLGEATHDALKNLPASSKKEVMAFLEAVKHPVKTWQAVKGLAKDTYKNQMAVALKDMGFEPSELKFKEGAMLEHIEQTPMLDAVMQDLENKYGTYEKFKQTLATDPARVITDLGAIAVPVAKTAQAGALVAKLPRVAATAEVLAKTGAMLDPVTAGLTATTKALKPISKLIPDRKPKAVRPDEAMASAAEEIGTAAKTIVGKEKKIAGVAEAVQPNKEILDAITDLGVVAEPLSSHISKNPTLRGLEQGLKKVPGSQLLEKERVFITELGEKADDLIREFGGETNKAVLSEKFRGDSVRLVEDLSNEASKLFKHVEDSVPANSLVNTDNILSSINKRAEKLGGTEYLDPLEIDLLKKLDPATKPTYARLDNLRKKVGAGMKSKGNKIFKNADEGALKNIYKHLAMDQMKYAEANGFGDAYKTANALVVQQKGIENQLVKVIGKELTGDIAVKGRTAILDLQKGSTKLFNELKANIPKELGKDTRRSVFASALNDSLVQGARADRALNVAGFDDFMKGLNRHSTGDGPTVRAMLQAEIGADAMKRLDSLHKVVGGVRTALAEVGQVPRIFDTASNITSKLYGMGRTGAVVEALVNIKRTPRSIAADDLMSNSKFIDMVKLQASGKIKNPTRANEIIKDMKEFKKWATTIDDKELAAMSVNALRYLTRTDKEEK